MFDIRQLTVHEHLKKKQLYMLGRWCISKNRIFCANTEELSFVLVRIHTFLIIITDLYAPQTSRCMLINSSHQTNMNFFPKSSTPESIGKGFQLIGQQKFFSLRIFVNLVHLRLSKQKGVWFYCTQRNFYSRLNGHRCSSIVAAVILQSNPTSFSILHKFFFLFAQ